MEIQIGKVVHYYNHLHVATISLTEELKLGDRIHIIGHSTDIIERVASMEVNYHPVVWVKPGDDVAIKVIEPVHEHDLVYRVVESALEPRPA